MEYLPSLQQEFDDLKPSLFELLAEQQLSDLLPPSIRYILAVATHRHPRYLLRILNSYDEIYALLSLLVERYYLRTFGGSFTENFYSLKRERVLLTKNGEIPRAQIGAPGPVREALKLRTRDVWKNLLIMVGIPYLKRKLDEGYDIHASPHASLIMSGGGGPRYHPGDELPPRPTLRQRLFHCYKWFLRNIYPSLNAGYYLSILAFNLAYLFDNTKYSSPFLWLIGTRIRRLSSADHRAIAAVLDPPASSSSPSRRPGSSLLGLLSPQNLHSQFLTSLRYFLPASIFALKFLEWYHASDFSRQLARKATEVLDLPAPVTNGMLPPSQRKSMKKKPTQSDEIKPTSSPPLKPALKSPTSPTAASVPPHKQQQHSANSDSPRQPPISASSYLPIFTVPLPPADSDLTQACPICLNPLTNPTACQTGYVFCYVCVFHWLNGEHQRQIDFMDGEAAAGAAWEEEDMALGASEETKRGDREAGREEEDDGNGKQGKRSRRGKWESGRGRCPVTGRRVLGGTEGLRRVLV
ncbi:ubiquitin-protein ligase peroxin 12 [Aspergillus saccharolyticus JOP 1030-1]|uniref:Peroxisome assembly protein 12 n=1 Tax=Aspergillus saccharolyticus JOP 1030-1 TaxID=1450539 RepID=A0A318Z3B0_9EURO|nr:putative peroxisome biosynthesis protein (PAS10/Peroxin-12) [Aspergillus saccharolyticus JOP 1030-1]PYH41566.1 putative peroxisome biosynthesis protein (PAS10/Peroxin-12) [Aspergillus saccharolyticus JOP 1030-1]